MRETHHNDSFNLPTSQRVLAPKTLSDASPLQKDILRTLAYFDIFDHPLTVEEIYFFLPSNSTSAENVSEACLTMPLNHIVSHADGYFSLTPDIVTKLNERNEKELRATKRWRIAVLMAEIIRRFPFVRAVFVSGELSKGVASKDSDIDYMIVTKPNRLWICRTLLILFKKFALLNSKKYFCVNLFISEDHLDVETKNLYSAVEVTTLKPLHNLALFNQYLQANDWVREYFPNWKTTQNDGRSVSSVGSVIQSIIELPFNNEWGDRLDGWLMQQWKQLWRRRYPDLDDERRGRLFQCRSFISTAYGEDFLSKVMVSYNTRLKEFGID